MKDGRPTTNEVFVNAVEDHLKGTPNARHPVQFVSVHIGDGMLPPEVVRCALCFSLVADTEEDQRGHRSYHDRHNKVHDEIFQEARAYKSPPTYR